MAITNENLSISGVENILSLGNTAYEHLVNDTKDVEQKVIIQQAIERIKEKIIFLVKLEKQILEKLNVPSRKALQDKIHEYNTTDFKMFYGENLQREFVRQFNKEANARRGNKRQQENALAELILDKIIEQIKAENVITDDLIAAIENKFIEWLGVTITDKNNITRTSSIRTKPIGGKGTDNDPAYIIVEKLSEVTRKRLQELIQQLNPKNKGRENLMTFKNFDELKDISIKSIKEKSKTMQIRVQSEWLKETEMLTISQIDEKCNLPGDEGAKWRDRRKQANENIIALIASKTGSDMRDLVVETLREHVKHYPNFFYVTTGTDITGILGELATVVAIKKLTGQTVSVKWAADNMDEDKSRKISVDVVLEKLLDIKVVEGNEQTAVGINVKNSGLDEAMARMNEHGISFVQRNPESIFNVLLDDMSSEDISNLSNAYQTSYFNKTYQIIWKASKTEHVQSSDTNKVGFEQIEKQLIDFREKLIIYLYRFAPEMMFMATDDLQKALLVLDNELSKTLAGAGNILYFVRGEVYFPSKILGELYLDLQQIQKNLDAQTDLSSALSSLFQIGHGQSKDIIDFLNDRAQHNQSVALRDIGAGEYDKALGTIAMKSSYRFGANK